MDRKIIRSGGGKADLVPEEGEKPDASAPVEEQGSLAIARWGDEAEHLIGLLWLQLKTQEAVCLCISPFGGRLALSRYRSVTRLWVLLSLAIKPGSGDGTREARQRSLLPSPLWKDSQLALLDLLNKGKIRPPAGGGVKAAFGALGASTAQPRILVMLRVPVKDLVRDQPASVVVANVAGAVLIRGELRVQLDDQEDRVRPEWKKDDVTGQPKGHMSLGQRNPMVAKLLKRGLTMRPEKPLAEKGKLGKNGSFGVRKQGGYFVVERSVLQFFMECRVVGSGSKVPIWTLRACLYCPLCGT
eukprot:s4_g14.t1